MPLYGETTTADEILAGLDLRGHRVVVTGVSAGLGVETARAFAARGATVIGTARNQEKAARALANAGPAEVELINLDLGSLESVRGAADRLVSRSERLDLIVANAGVMAMPFGQTEDGFEAHFGTNHLGHFVFVNRIASLLREGGRVVSLSSAAHHFSDVDLEDPNFVNTSYDRWQAYGRSKTANALFAVEFDRRYKHQGIQAAAVHPGSIETEIGRHLSQEDIGEMIAMIERSQDPGAPAFRFKTLAQGAATSIWAGVVASADEIGGRYCENCRVAEIVSSAATLSGVKPYAVNPYRAQALWDLSERLVGERF